MSHDFVILKDSSSSKIGTKFVSHRNSLKIDHKLRLQRFFGSFLLFLGDKFAGKCESFFPHFGKKQKTCTFCRKVSAQVAGKVCTCGCHPSTEGSQSM